MSLNERGIQLRPLRTIQVDAWFVAMPGCAGSPNVLSRRITILDSFPLSDFDDRLWYVQQRVYHGWTAPQRDRHTEHSWN